MVSVGFLYWDYEGTEILNENEEVPELAYGTGT